MPVNAFSLLALQPTSLVELEQAARANVVVSAVLSDGLETVISRYGDAIWNLWPFFKQSNVGDAKKQIRWSGVPAQFVDAVKLIVYRYWMQGLPGQDRPKAVTVIRVVHQLTPFLRWLEATGVTQLSSVRRLHVSSFAAHARGVEPTKEHLSNVFHSLQILHVLGEGGDSLSFDPWQGSSAKHEAGLTGRSGARSAKTPVIPDDVLSPLFNFAERVALAPATARASTPLHCGGAELTVRNACFFLLGIFTGMRQEELVGIRVGAYRREVKNGVTYHWVRAIENKITGGEDVEYLMPELGREVLRIMEDLSAPLRARLVAEMASLSVAPSAESESDRAKRLRRLARATSDQDRLFLTSAHGDGVSALTADGVRSALKTLAKGAGVDWPLAPHQLRRTFVVECAHHELGDLVYLKKHLKHRSLSMTELYAMNERQDESLFNELLDAHLEVKADLITHLLDPQTVLAGSAAPDVEQVRRQLTTLRSRRELAEDTAEIVNIRGTGHAWCLSQFEGCGGTGLWERTQCAPCTDGLIDERHIPAWQAIYSQQRELEVLKPTLGAGAARRIDRDLKRAGDTLRKLGIPLDD
ncbi:MAG: tyrosine-type recombinase/integrase [Rhizobacter sp.]